MGSKARIIYSLVPSQGHFHNKGHVECPERIDGIMRALEETGFLENGRLCQYARPLLTDRAPSVEANPLKMTSDLVDEMHQYASGLKKLTKDIPLGEIAVLADDDDPDGVTYATKTSYMDALLTVDSTVQLVNAVYKQCLQKEKFETKIVDSKIIKDEEGISISGFGINRPPGHHATPLTPLGFCIFNNIAIAAHYARSTLGASRVFILDFDVHNGNGTADIFWNDPNVFVLDIHEKGCGYMHPPWTPSGAGDVGGENAKGTTINIPFPGNAGHDCLILTFQEIVAPVIRRFNPDIILVSAGYDAHAKDPFELLQFSSKTYYFMAKELKAISDDICHGRLLFLLEGGYNPDALGEAVAATWLGLSNLSLEQLPFEKQPSNLLPEPREEVENIINKLKDQLNL